MSGVEFYIRLQLLLLESCKVLRKLFSHNAENDSTTGVPYTTMESYIKKYEPKIKSLVKKRSLRQKQYDILFNSGKQVCENNMDMTLVSCLLLKIVPNLPPQDRQAIEDIRDIRNKLNHHEDITALDANYFRKESNILENSMQRLSSTIHATYVTETKKAIKEVMNNPLPPPGPYLDVIKELAMVVRDIEYLKEATDMTNSQLKSIIHENKKPNEPPMKMVKTYPQELERMQTSFRDTKQTMKKSDPVCELSSMESTLRDYRGLYVRGQTPELYLNTVLIAIDNLCGDVGRCVEMNECSEWKYINRKYVDLVLFRFGSESISEQGQACACFDKILANFKLPLDERMYIIIISDIESHRLLMKECDGERHRLLSKFVDIKEPTSGSLEDPHTVNDDKTTAAMKYRSEGTLKNLKEHTKIYMDHFKMESVPVHCLKEAKGLLKRHRHLRIDGPRGSGRMSLAVKLLSSDKLDKCLLLRRPTDEEHICLKELSVVLIEDFQGKYEQDRHIALQWYRVFDLLLAMVRSGKLEVVITTETTMFEACDLPKHELLKPLVTLTPFVRPVVKVDPDQPSTSDSLPGSAEVSPNRKRTSLWEDSFQEAGITCVEASNITECTFLPTGHLVLACVNSVVLMDIELKKALSTIQTKAVDICVATEKEVVTVDGNSPNLHVLNIGVEPLFMTSGRHINIEDALGYKVQCQSVDASNNEIYVLCEYTGVYEVHILSNRGEILTTIPFGGLGLGFKSGTKCENTKLKINRTTDKMFLSSPRPDRTIYMSTPTGQRKYERTDCFFHRVMYIDDEDTYLARKGINGEVLIFDSKGRKRGLQFKIDTQSCIGYRESDGYLVIGCSDKIRIYCPA